MKTKEIEIDRKVMTYQRMVDEYKKLFPIMGYDYNFSGYADTIHTFNLCSDYDIELNGSTIDKIELTQDGRIYFYYNQNTNDLDPIESFPIQELKSFYDKLVDAWNENSD